MRLCALSVDLDEIDNYRALHGVAARPQGAHAVYDLALSRLVGFAREQQLPLTLFAIGRDLERAEAAEGLAGAATQGHLVESHSYSHRYDLSRLGEEAIYADLARAQQLIERVTGRAPLGFRAPGYTTSDAMLRAVARAGLRYDASSLPSPPYQLAKVMAMLRVRLLGRDSAAIVDGPRAALAPRNAHPIEPSLRTGTERETDLAMDNKAVLPLADGAPLWELPMAVTRRLRLPVIGTSLTLAGLRGARLLVRGCVDLPLISLELHGIDLLDEHDGLDDLRPHQPDVRLSVARKRAALAAAVDELRGCGYRFVTLSEAYEQLMRWDGVMVAPGGS